MVIEGEQREEGYPISVRRETQRKEKDYVCASSGFCLFHVCRQPFEERENWRMKVNGGDNGIDYGERERGQRVEGERIGESSCIMNEDDT